jgi:hypothetical protein
MAISKTPWSVSRNCTRIFDADDKRIAIVEWNGSPDDCRVMRAAPRLLEACRAMRDVIGAYDCAGRAEKMILDAIAEAEGG